MTANGVTDQEIVDAARAYLGVRWGHQGRAVGERHRRIDCVGLLYCTMRDLGVAVADRTNYLPIPDGTTLVREMKTQLIECPERELRPGRIVAFDDIGEPSPCHVGILTDHDAGVGVIHASMNHQKVVEHRLDDFWRGKVRGVFRFAEETI